MGVSRSGCQLCSVTSRRLLNPVGLGRPTCWRHDRPAAGRSLALGVVLRPCLLIVVVASLNKEVTTDLLYQYGVYVFLLTSTLFLIIALFFAEHRFRISGAVRRGGAVRRACFSGGALHGDFLC